MLIGSLVVIVAMKDVLFKVSSFVVDGVETGEIISVFFNFFKTLLDDEREVLDDGGDVFLAHWRRECLDSVNYALGYING